MSDTLDPRDETPAEEFSRLIIEFNEGERQNRAEAWNLIADFAMEHSDTILRALRAPSPSPAPGMVEALREAAETLEWASRRMKGNCSGSDVNAVILAASRARKASLSQPAKGDNPGLVGAAKLASENVASTVKVSIPANPAQVTDALDRLEAIIHELAGEAAPNGPEDRAWAIINDLRAALTAAIGAGGQAVADIGDAVLAWMVKYDLLDGDNEYQVADVMAVMDDLVPSSALFQPHPADERVVEALREAQKGIAAILENGGVNINSWWDSIVSVQQGIAAVLAATEDRNDG